jgi:hypothetical protein
MKHKLLIISILIILVLTSIAFLIFSKNHHLMIFGTVVLLGLFAGIVNQLFTAYLIPSLKIFKYRFVFNGIANGVFISLLIFFIDYFDHSGTTWLGFVVILIIGQVVTVPLNYGTKIITFNNLKEKTRLKKNDDEIALISDRATLIDGDTYIMGRLILTNQRLCFRSKKVDCTKHDILFNNFFPEFEKLKFLGIPSGFSTKDKRMQVKINFPLFWEREIRKVHLKE